MNEFDEVSKLRLLMNLMWLADPQVDQKETKQLGSKQKNNRTKKSEPLSLEGIGFLLCILGMEEVLESLCSYKELEKNLSGKD